MMNKLFLTILLTILSLGIKAQMVTVTKLTHNINTKAIDVDPEFPGGAKAFYRYISKNIVYDKDAKPADMQGIVTVSLAVEKDGHITDVKMIKGVSDVLDNEVLRVINASPAWRPGMKQGVPIKVRYTFRIELSTNGTNRHPL